MATLTLGKSVTIDAVQSKKGDAVFVERRRRVVAPGSKELREEPVTPATPRNAADEKLRAVLEAARAREEERKQRAAAEAAATAAREAEIARENREYEQSKNSWPRVKMLPMPLKLLRRSKRLRPCNPKSSSPRPHRVAHPVMTMIWIWAVRPSLATQKKNLRKRARFHCTTL